MIIQWLEIAGILILYLFQVIDVRNSLKLPFAQRTLTPSNTKEILRFCYISLSLKIYSTLQLQTSCLFIYYFK